MRVANIVIVLTLFSKCGIAQTNFTPPASEPTLKETTDWLELHLVGINGASERTVVDVDLKKTPSKETMHMTFDSHESITSAKFIDCVLTLATEHQEQRSTYSAHSGSYVRSSTSVTSMVRIPFTGLKDASSRIYFRPLRVSKKGTETSTTTPDTMITVEIESLTSSIRYTAKTVNSPPEPSDGVVSDMGKYFRFDTDDKEIVPRLINAFKHTIVLCQTNAKPEHF